MMGIITGETFYPEGYSTRNNEISDLGATRPPNSIITEPSATIFNTTMIVTGIMAILAMGLLHSHHRKIWLTTIFALFGLGLLGVGVFPGNAVPWHPAFAMATFVFGGLGAIASAKIINPPLNILFIVLGTLSLVFLFLSELFIPYLGMGGTERWVAYPIVFWMMGMGAYLNGANNRSTQ